MKQFYLWAIVPLGALMFGSTTVTAAPVTINLCSETGCWNGSYQIQDGVVVTLSLIHISEPTRLDLASRMPSSA